MKIRSIKISFWLHPRYGGREIINDQEAEIICNDIKEFIKSKGYNIKDASNKEDYSLAIFK